MTEAVEQVSAFEQAPDVLAAVLTGSAAWGSPNPDGDLDILLITRNRRGVLYRYLIPEFAPVPRRTELGFLPEKIVSRHIGESYGTLISCRMIEQFKNCRVLFQKNGCADKLIESARRSDPGMIIIGKSVNEIRNLFDGLRATLEADLYAGAIFAARRIAGTVARLLLLARKRISVSKEKHEYRAVRKSLNSNEITQYEKLMNIHDTSEEKSRRTVERTIDLFRGIVESRSLSTELVTYEGIRSQPERAAVR
jgi:hypothetical protein